MIKTARFTIVFLFIFQSAAFALIGHETKRERLKREGRDADVGRGTARRAPATQTFMEKLYENFLKGNYSETENLAAKYLISHSSFQDADEAAYLQALSLLRLGRSNQARVKLNALGQSARSWAMKAAACASLGDSYFVEKRPDLALLWYEEVLEKYPDADEASYVREQIRKVGRPAEKTKVKEVVPDKLFYTVQVGSFSSERNAKTLIKKLEDREYSAYLEEDGAKHLFRVRVGRLAQKKDALILESLLQREGYVTRIYP